MCLIFLSIDQHPQYKLIVAANRDEFYDRKTDPAQYWTDYPKILGGRDLEAGGTWMGIHQNGRLAMVTNYRDMVDMKPLAPSRGNLVSEFLLGTNLPADYMQTVAQKGPQYNGFNLIAGTADRLYYYSNYDTKGPRKIAPGFYGLSNHLLNTPWPKVTQGLQKMRKPMTAEKLSTTAIFEALHDTTLADDADLPDTGIGYEKEKALSAMFIKMRDYGTRCSTVLAIDRAGKVKLAERVYNTTTFEHTDRVFSFLLPQ